MTSLSKRLDQVNARLQELDNTHSEFTDKQQQEYELLEEELEELEWNIRADHYEREENPPEDSPCLDLTQFHGPWNG